MGAWRNGKRRALKTPKTIGSNPIAPTKERIRKLSMENIDRITTGAVAQWLEHSADNREVDGSIPSSSTNFNANRK